MTRSKTKSTQPPPADPPTPPAPRAAPKTCGYPDGGVAVAVQETPRGPRYLCEHHAASQRHIGVEVEDL